MHIQLHNPPYFIKKTIITGTKFKDTMIIRSYRLPFKLNQKENAYNPSKYYG
jgi:hypothetical protein